VPWEKVLTAEEKAAFDIMVAELAQRRLDEEAARKRRVERAKTTSRKQAAAWILGSLFVALLFLRQEQEANNRADQIEAEALAREEQIEAESLAREAQLEAESKARALANCEASNDSRAGIRDFILNKAPGFVTPQEALEGFPVRDCVEELLEPPIGEPPPKESP
jgi:hypothetical protein